MLHENFLMRCSLPAHGMHRQDSVSERSLSFPVRCSRSVQVLQRAAPTICPNHCPGVTMNRVLRSAVVATLLVPAVALLAQASEPANMQELQKARHDHYHEHGEAFKVVRDESRAGKPDLAKIRT